MSAPEAELDDREKRKPAPSRKHLDRLEEGAVAPVRSGRGSLDVLEISRRPNPLERILNVWRYRELLVTLTRKELKVKYRGSVLGFVWSLVNPALYIVVFSIVFGVLMKQNIHNFALLMMCGIVPWNFFIGSATGGTMSITGNGALVNKVWFPREILPFASVGAALVHLLLQGMVLGVFLAAFRQVPSAEYATLIVPALLVIVVLACALALLFGALNVYFRDVQHMVELLFLVWFWATPIVYPFPLVLEKFGHPTLLSVLNPLIAPILAINRALFNASIGTNVAGASFALPVGSVWWYARNLAIAGVMALLLLWFALWLFGRLEDNFGEEL
jgi:ABC-2 type transport system permease protein